MKVYGCRISYYTGKLEAYLRYRSIGYELLPTVGNEKELRAATGVAQMPVVKDSHGRWMTDTTPIIAQLESEQSASTVYPDNPMMNFIALLIEDYADEWLWRSAMHFRWSYRVSRQYAAEVLYDDLIKDNPNRYVPRFIALRLLKIRQYFGFVRGDGVNKESIRHADSTYFNSLELLEAIFQLRPFLLGDTPTIADIGLMGPMFRHFSQDPVPSEIMRERAPSVFEWVARMWNARANGQVPNLLSEPDSALVNLLQEVSETHLAQLQQNAFELSNGKKRFDLRIQGTTYRNVPSSRYRVWCLEELQREWRSLDLETQGQLKAMLTSPEASIIWDERRFNPSNYDSERDAPFNKAICVYGNGVPPR
ncbi:MAG: glutathione S-transferase family protein [Halioglobus sp.]